MYKTVDLRAWDFFWWWLIYHGAESPFRIHRENIKQGYHNCKIREYDDD